MAYEKYSLPELPFGAGDLKSFLSEEQIKIHHEKHHNAYVTQSNGIIEILEEARKSGSDVDMKAILKNLSFNLGGHFLHSLFWENLAPAGTGGEITDKLDTAIKEGFGGMERLKKEFIQAALSVEGSGWAALAACPVSGRLMLAQIEKHNVNITPSAPVLLVLDMFEHAYYIDYKNDKTKYAENFWNFINWQVVGERFEIL